MDEVADVRLCEHGDNVDMWLNRLIRDAEGKSALPMTNDHSNHTSCPPYKIS